MRRKIYIYDQKEWPDFTWNEARLSPLLATVRHRQGKITGRLAALGFDLQQEANLQTLTLEVIKTSEIEGEKLDMEQVRSSVARHLGINLGGLVPVERHVEGMVEVMIDATTNYLRKLTKERLYSWHAAMFPTGRTGLRTITVGAWRTNDKKNPKQVVSGAPGKERVHFEAPASKKIKKEMKAFLKWFNQPANTDPVLKAGIAHLWFVTIHPFDDGNGRITRALTDMLLARSDESPLRFYSMSSQIRNERKAYYDILEKSQRGTPDITGWLQWFLSCLNQALTSTEETLSRVLAKANFWKTYANETFNARQQKMLNTLLDHFEGKLTSSKWAKITKCSQDTALRDIQQLLDLGVLRKESAGGRSTSYVMTPIPPRDQGQLP